MEVSRRIRNMLQTSKKQDSERSNVRYFETIANMSVSSRVNVQERQMETAACAYDEDRHRHDVQIRAERFPIHGELDERLDAPDSAISRLIKEGMLYHELGHVLFTDYDGWMDVLQSESRMQVRRELKHTLNMMEDSVIEQYLIEQFGISHLLSLKNESKHESIGMLSRNPTIDHMFQGDINALELARLTFEETGRYRLGFLDEHFGDSDNEFEVAGELSADEIIYRSNELMNECLTEPNARKRYRLVRDFVEDIVDENGKDETIHDGQDISGMHNRDDDHPQSGQEQNSMFVPVPDIEEDEDGEESDGSGDEDDDEAGSGSGSAGDDDDDDDLNQDEESDKTGVGEDEDEDEDDEPVGSDDADADDDGTDVESGGQEEDEKDLPNQIDQDDLDYRAQQQVESGDEEELESESGTVDKSDMGMEQSSSVDVDLSDLDEEKMKQLMAGDGDGEVCHNRDKYTDWSVDASRKNEAKRKSRSIAKIIEDHLHQAQRTRTKRDKLNGRFDSQNLIDAERGSPRVFKSDDKPDELDYNAVFLMDDSGSMGGERLQIATMAVASLVKGFEKAGISSTVFRFAGKTDHIKNPFDDWDRVANQLLALQTDGGTNMRSSLQRAAEIEEETEPETMLVSITDGKPSHVDRCEELIEDFGGHSICLQIGQETDKFDDAYDALSNVDNSADIGSALRKMVRRTVFR